LKNNYGLSGGCVKGKSFSKKHTPLIPLSRGEDII